jgi:hypothetical protein
MNGMSSHPKEHWTKSPEKVCESVLVLSSFQRYQVISVFIQRFAVTLKSGKGSFPVPFIPELAVESTVRLH